VLQGYKVVSVPEAVAYDKPPSSTSAEFNSRVRITARSFSSIMRKWDCKSWFKHPFISWALLSHRFLRWLTPYFMLLVFISNIFLLDQGWFYQLTFLGQIAFYLAGLAGWVGESRGMNLPIASMIFSFCVASAGMMVGVAKGIWGRAPATYEMPD
jgi:cellulose synthase/poly-beta-1,6-N-acetylglucosamine synthase-like glycosyltransferase